MQSRILSPLHCAKELSDTHQCLPQDHYGPCMNRRVCAPLGDRGSERRGTLIHILRSQPIGTIRLEGKIRSAGGIFMSGSQQPKNYLHVLSLLALCPSRAAEVISYFAGLDSHGRNQLLALTDSHHVVLRALQPLGQAATRAGLAEIAQFAQGAINKERGRIENALKFLDAICREFECAGCPVAVIKTLRSEEHTSELQSLAYLVCRLLLEKKKSS